MNDVEKKTTAELIGKDVSAAPQVSIVIPAYNIAAYITETLESVLAQTYKNYEIILVNDGSPDTPQLKTALQPYFDRIVYIEQENAGASEARNAAIRRARGRLLAFLDGDDVWLPDFLESQTKFLNKNNLEMVYCDALIFGETLLNNRTYMQDAPSVGAVTTVSLINADCNVITSGTILKRALLDEFGLFDAALRRAQDFDLWFRLAKKGVRIGYQTKVLLKYRARPESLTGTNVDRAERTISAMNAVREKYDLTEDEQAAWEQTMFAYEAERELEKGKLCLVEEDFKGARTHFAAANEFYRKPKLSLLGWLLSVAPRLTMRLFKTIRPSEFSLIAPDKL